MNNDGITQFKPMTWSASVEVSFEFNGLQFHGWWTSEEGWDIDPTPGDEANWTDTEWDQFYSAQEDLPIPRLTWPKQMLTFF